MGNPNKPRLTYFFWGGGLEAPTFTDIIVCLSVLFRFFLSFRILNTYNISFIIYLWCTCSQGHVIMDHIRQSVLKSDNVALKKDISHFLTFLLPSSLFSFSLFLSLFPFFPSLLILSYWNHTWKLMCTYMAWCMNSLKKT